MRADRPTRPRSARPLRPFQTIGVIPFEEEHWNEAAAAFRRYGKGRHPAGLNLGNCMTYATARLAQRPLLCLGDDFAQTDLALA